ncbi:MAG TPA: TetR/AcrR family transcriptional regulator [Candidatus Avidesulfovibrio excrementigallinarum]|nr:TetR/AcrR family transcriptional regulator [Candidatus Avidesulfovibrio excrementigallinarum]
MSTSTSRTYNSKLRAHQAEATRNRILVSAEALFIEHGYEKTTITAIAAGARVAPQTVYAAFGSKVGVVSAILNRIRSDERYQALHQKAMQTTDPCQSLHVVAHLICEIYDSRALLFEQLLGTLATSQELAAHLEAQYLHDRKLSRIYMSSLHSRGCIREELDIERALDIFWVLINFSPYQMLVRHCRWTSQAYVDWLTSLLCRELLRHPPQEMRR